MFAHIVVPDVLYVFAAGVGLVMALALHFSGERCAGCGRRGPFVASDHDGRPLCVPCAPTGVRP